MRPLLFTLAIFTILGTGCESRKENMKASRRDAIIDSLVGLKLGDLTREAEEDLDRRRAIEIKAKADSILMVRSGKAVRDTAAPPDNPFPHNLPKP